MSIKKIETGRYKVVVRVWPNLKKEATVFGTLDDAKAKELELKHLLYEDRTATENSRSLKFKTFGECLELYNQSRTWGDDKYNRLKQDLAHIQLPELWDALKSFVKHLQKQKTRNGKDFTPATINRHISIAKAAVNLAYKERKLESNILSGFPTIREDNKRYRILSNQEREALFNELVDYLKPMFYFASRVPCRAGELVNLKRSAYNPERGLIILEDGTTKNGQGRWLPVFPEMKEYFDTLPKESEYLFYRNENSRYLPLGYWSEKEKRVIPNFKKAWVGACERAEIKGYNVHKLRQQSAMQLLYDDFREFEVMMIGGWKSYDAFRRYVQADEVMLLKKLGKWENDDSWKQTLAPVVR